MSMLWIAVGILLVIAVVMKIFQGKTFCKVCIFEEDNGKIIQHGQNYKGIIREAVNKSKTHKLKWLWIDGLKKNFIIPQSKFFTHTTGKINKSLYLLWDGKESFKVIKPKLNKFVFEQTLVNGHKYYKSIPLTNVEFNMNDNDWEYMQSELMDTLENIYKEKESFLEKLKPYYALAVIALITIIAIYMVQKTAVATSTDIKESKNWIVGAIEGMATRNPDPNTAIIRSTQGDTNVQQGQEQS